MGTPLDAIGALLAGLLGLWALRALLDERHAVGAFVAALGRARPQRTDSAALGRVRLEGKAQKHHRLIPSPLHQVPCLAYRLEVERMIREHTKRPAWQLIYTENGAAPFLLRDDSGEARVEAGSKAVCELRTEVTVEQGALGSLPEHIQKLLRREGIKTKGLVLSRSIRVRERRLDPGEPCTVVGEVLRREAIDGPDTYRSATSRPVIGAGEGRLYLGDRHARDILRPYRVTSGLYAGVAFLGFGGAAFLAGRLLGLL